MLQLPFAEKHYHTWRGRHADIKHSKLALVARRIWWVGSELNCVAGRLLVQRLDKVKAQRQRQANRLITALQKLAELKFQRVTEGYQYVYHLMSSHYDGSQYGKKNDDLIALFYSKYNLKCIVRYGPMYRAELFREFRLGSADVPNTNKQFDNMGSFP